VTIQRIIDNLTIDEEVRIPSRFLSRLFAEVEFGESPARWDVVMENGVATIRPWQPPPPDGGRET
jgi:hypothetical protein